MLLVSTSSSRFGTSCSNPVANRLQADAVPQRKPISNDCTVMSPPESSSVLRFSFCMGSQHTFEALRYAIGMHHGNTGAILSPLRHGKREKVGLTALCSSSEVVSLVASGSETRPLSVYHYSSCQQYQIDPDVWDVWDRAMAVTLKLQPWRK